MLKAQIVQIIISRQLMEFIPQGPLRIHVRGQRKMEILEKTEAEEIHGSSQYIGVCLVMFGGNPIPGISDQRAAASHAHESDPLVSRGQQDNSPNGSPDGS